MIKKVILSLLFLVIMSVILMVAFGFGLYSITGIVNKKDVLSFSYMSVASLITPVISVTLIDIGIRGAYLFFKKNEKIQKSYNTSGVLILLWLLISFPLSWVGIYHLTSNGYQKCPPTSLFTQYYTTDLSLCSNPYGHEKTGTK